MRLIGKFSIYYKLMGTVISVLLLLLISWLSYIYVFKTMWEEHTQFKSDMARTKSEMQMPAKAVFYIKPNQLVDDKSIIQQLEYILHHNLPVKLLKFNKEPVRRLGNLYEHTYKIVFVGDYAHILDYLSHLNKSPYLLLWHHINFTTITYPQIEVTMLFGVLSVQETWI